MIESQSPEADAPGCHFGDHRGEHYLAVLRRLQTVLRPRTYLEVGTHSGKSLMQVDCSSIAVDPDFGGLLPNVITSKPSCHFMQMTRIKSHLESSIIVNQNQAIHYTTSLLKFLYDFLHFRDQRKRL